MTRGIIDKRMESAGVRNRQRGKVKQEGKA